VRKKPCYGKSPRPITASREEMMKRREAARRFCQMVTSGTKLDAGKLPVDLLPMRALLEVAKVLRFGAEKYEREGWRTVKPRRRYYAAAMRHIIDRALGRKLDPESGLPTLAHAACDLLFLLAFEVGFDPIDTFDTETFEESDQLSADQHPAREGKP
jgi:hypothetical protein